MDKQIRSGLIYKDGWKAVKDYKKTGDIAHIQNLQDKLSQMEGEGGRLNLAYGLNEKEYNNLLLQVNEYLALQEKMNDAQKAQDSLEGKTDDNPPPAPARPADLGGVQTTASTPQVDVAETQVDAGEAQKAADGLARSLENLQKLKSQVKSAVDEAESFLASVDWSNHGLRMMQTLAQGIKTGGPIVRSAVQQQLAGLPNGASSGKRGLYDSE